MRKKKEKKNLPDASRASFHLALELVMVMECNGGRVVSANNIS